MSDFSAIFQGVPTRQSLGPHLVLGGPLPSTERILAQPDHLELVAAVNEAMLECVRETARTISRRVGNVRKGWA